MKRQLVTMMIAGGLLAAGAPGWAQEAKQDSMSQDKMSQDKMSGEKASGDKMSSDGMAKAKMDDQGNMPHDKTGGKSNMKQKKSKKESDKMGDSKDKMKSM